MGAIDQLIEAVNTARQRVDASLIPRVVADNQITIDHAGAAVHTPGNYLAYVSVTPVAHNLGYSPKTEVFVALPIFVELPFVLQVNPGGTTYASAYCYVDNVNLYIVVQTPTPTFFAGGQIKTRYRIFNLPVPLT